MTYDVAQDANNFSTPTHRVFMVKTRELKCKYTVALPGHKYVYVLLARTYYTQRKSSNDNLIPDGLVIIPTPINLQCTIFSKEKQPNLK
jgi:hypothetical protein